MQTTSSIAAHPLVIAAQEEPDIVATDAVFLGTGLATRTHVAVGDLPLDALAMLLVAEYARTVTGASRIVHLLADEHALVNGFAGRTDVMRAARVAALSWRRVAERLGVYSYELVRASEIDDPLHARLYAVARERCPEPYAAREAADIEWARLRYGAAVKIGWTMQPRLDLPPGGFDERYFDAEYRRVFGDRITTLYTLPGRRLDPTRPRTSPYVVEPGDRRVTLSSSPADVAELCASRSMRRHLRPLVSELEEVLDLEPTDDLATAVIAVISALNHTDQEVLSHAA